jgi:hypothetical protein
MRIMEFRKWPVDGGATADAAQKLGRRALPGRRHWARRALQEP